MNINLQENMKYFFKEALNEKYFFSILFLAETIHQIWRYFYKHFYWHNFFILFMEYNIWSQMFAWLFLKYHWINGFQMIKLESHRKYFVPLLGSLGESSPWDALGQLWELP